MIKIAVFSICILLIIIAAFSFLQIYLSRKKSKWPGLILPSVFIILSLVWTLSIYRLDFSHNPENTAPLYSYDEEGNIEEKIEKKENMNRSYTVESSADISVRNIITVFIAMNIPSIVFLFIYGICRERMRSKLEMQKMAIQDLN